MMLGGLEHDERRMLNDLISHFVQALNKERARSADLALKLETASARLELLEAAAYGLF